LLTSLLQFGDAKVAFRARIREILRKLGFIYPPSKLLTRYLDDGLPSKNVKVRTECLTEVGYIFAKNGMHICNPPKVLPLVAKQISDRDATVRHAALGALGEAHRIVGDSIYELCGNVPAKERSMLEERLKRAPGAKVAPTSPRGSKIAPPSKIARTSMLPPPTARSRLSTLPKPAAVAKKVEAAPAPAPEPEPAEEELQGEEVAEEEEDLGIEHRVNEVLSSDWNRSAEALKYVDLQIKECDPDLSRYADQLLIVLSKQFHRAFAVEEEPPEIERVRRYLTVTGTSFFGSTDDWEGKPLAAYVTQTSLIPLLTELLQILIEATRAAENDPLKKYSKYLNILVLKSFSVCDLNVLYE
jgi:cytoskeleton-associated protein 5